MDCTVCRQRNVVDSDDRRIAHDNLRAVVVEAGDPSGVRAGWTAVPEGSGLWVGTDRVPQLG
jgi:hypothetical protein